MDYEDPWASAKELSYSPENTRASKRPRVCDLEGSLCWHVEKRAKNGLRETSQKLTVGSVEDHPASRDASVAKLLRLVIETLLLRQANVQEEMMTGLKKLF